MNASSHRPSTRRYLSVVGSVNRWFHAVFIAFAVWYLYLRMLGEKSYYSQYAFLFLFPMAAGTGLLTAARRGEFDLLFGAGTTRGALWRGAFCYGPAMAGAMALIIFQISGHGDLPTSLRLLAVLLFTGGIAYCSGMIETRYFAGVLWLLARMVYLMWPSGFRTLLSIEKGPEIPSHGALALLVLFVPECLLYSRMPVVHVLVSAGLGLVALGASWVWFQRSDLGGHRA